MKKILIITSFIILSFLGINELNAQEYSGNPSLSIGGVTIPYNTTVLITSGRKDINLNLGSGMPIGSTYFVRFEICNTTLYDNISWSSNFGTLTKTNKYCNFTGNAEGERGTLWYADFKWTSNISSTTSLTLGGSFNFTPKTGQFPQTRLQLMRWYNIDPASIEIENKIDDTNNKLDDLNNSIKDETPPDTSEFGDVSGWLPAGPVDSILTLPLNVLNSISNSLNSNCNSVNLPLPFIDKELSLMCGTEFYKNISGLSMFLNTLFTILGGITLYKYFVYLYNWIDRIVSLKEKDEKWGAT